MAHARAAANYEQVAAVSGVGLALPGGCDRLLAPLGVRTLLDRILRRTGFRRLAIAAELA